MAECSIAVFDLGGVLIDWNPRYLYRKLFDGDTEAMEEFLATVCTQSWNAIGDRFGVLYTMKTPTGSLVSFEFFD
jgi:hypothetical protein